VTDFSMPRRDASADPAGSRQTEAAAPDEECRDLPTAPGSSRTRFVASLQNVGRGLTPVRLASHLAIVFVVGLVLVLSQVSLPRWELSRSEPATSADHRGPSDLTDEPLPLVSFWPNRGGSGLTSSESLMPAAVPFTVIPERPRLEMFTYVVQGGDTLSGIAQRFDLQLNTVMWAGGLELCPQLLRVGQELAILPVDGVHHIVEPGDTLLSIAETYSVQPQAIVGWEPNGLEDVDTPLAEGQVLIIPGGVKESITTGIAAYGGEGSEPSAVGTGRFAWPVRGTVDILDWFGTTTLGGRPGGVPRSFPHNGVDLTAYLGSPILAADSGTVTVAQYGGYNGGYGNYVVIDHRNGFSTLYGHLSAIAVQSGQIVAKGERIGSAGATGMATGPHLHFEIRYKGVTRNPLCFLSGG
jgi:murein DD-endopeptidase MepM/ murein hydrolase activator NlpD